MNAYWKYQYHGHLIEVKNSTNHTELYCDGILLDKQKGLISVSLAGVLPEGEQLTAEVKAGFVPKCSVQVYGTALEEIEE